jgi:hypothetical protein
MNKLIAIAVGLLFVLGLASCAPSSAQVATAVKATVDAQLNAMSTVTKTLVPSHMPTSTRTITKTRPPTQTPLPSETPLSPKEKTATQEMKIYTETAIARTKLSEAKRATATKIAEYHEIFVSELHSYANKHIGEKVKMYIVIFNINSDTELQGWMNGTWEPLYVKMAEPFTGLYEDHGITVYGTVSGEDCGENIYGGQNCDPTLVDSFYTK